MDYEIEELQEALEDISERKMVSEDVNFSSQLSLKDQDIKNNIRWVLNLKDNQNFSGHITYSIDNTGPFKAEVFANKNRVSLKKGYRNIFEYNDYIKHMVDVFRLLNENYIEEIPNPNKVYKIEDDVDEFYRDAFENRRIFEDSRYKKYFESVRNKTNRISRYETEKYSLYVSNNLSKKQLKKLIKYINLIHEGFEILFKKKIKMKLIMVLSDIIKKFDFGEIDANMINSGFTIGNEYIYIYRKEEYLKVLIHEAIHLYSIDKYLFPNINKEFSFKRKNSLYYNDSNESITETLAAIINIILNGGDMQKFFEYEKKFSVLQTAKILHLAGFNSFKEFINENSTKKVIESTPAIGYHMYKSVFLHNIERFINIIFEGIKLPKEIMDKLNKENKRTWDLYEKWVKEKYKKDEKEYLKKKDKRLGKTKRRIRSNTISKVKRYKASLFENIIIEETKKKTFFSDKVDSMIDAIKKLPKDKLLYLTSRMSISVKTFLTYQKILKKNGKKKETGKLGNQKKTK